MKRLGRWLFNLAAGVSVLLCVATVVLWIRSYSVCEYFVYSWNQSSSWHNVGLTYDGGWFTIYTAFDGTRVRGRGYIYQKTTPFPIRFPQSAWGSGPLLLSYHGVSAQESGVAGIYIKAWLAMLLAAIVPAFWLGKNRRSAPAPGHCHICGYDLRATPDRCPECGTAREPMKGAAT